MRQKARIISRTGDSLQCVVECGDACAKCAAHKVCAPSNAQSGNIKTLTLMTTDESLKPGDMITVEITTAMGLRAVLLAYLIPVAIIIGLLLALQQSDLSELTSGGITLGVVALYFLAIKIFGLGRTISVEIVDKDTEELI